jgi:hypothetical protein
MTLNDLMHVELNPFAYAPPDLHMPAFEVLLGFGAFLMAAPYLALAPFALVAILWAIFRGDGPVWARITLAALFLPALVAIAAMGL